MKIKSKLVQTLLAAMVSIFGVLSSHAQEHLNSFKFKTGDTLPQSGILKPGEGLKSKNGQHVALLQKDGNFCLYKVDEKAEFGVQFVHCTMTVGDADKQGAFLGMQNDGNLALYNSKKAHLWSTDTYQGSEEQKGRRLVMQDDGKLILYSRNNQVAIYDFQKGRLY